MMRSKFGKERAYCYGSVGWGRSGWNHGRGAGAAVTGNGDTQRARKDLLLQKSVSAKLNKNLCRSLEHAMKSNVNFDAWIKHLLTRAKVGSNKVAD